MIFLYFTIVSNKKAEKIDLYSFTNKNINQFNDDGIIPLNSLSNKVKLLKLLTNNDEREYKSILECLLNDPDTKYCIYHLISPKLVLGKDRILLGENLMDVMYF